MKRVFALFLLTALLLSGCAKTEITVDTQAQTMSDGTYTYQYTDKTEDGTRSITITYPNGTMYFWNVTGNSRSGSYLGNYDTETYVPAEDLLEALVGPTEEQEEDTSTYSYTHNNIICVVDREKQIITAGGYEFPYTMNETETCVTYPNGAVAVLTHATEDNIGGGVSWRNADAQTISNDGADYVDCYALLNAAPKPQRKAPWKPNIPAILVGVLFVGLGSWQHARPYYFWKRRVRFWVQNAEPTDRAIGWIAAEGIIDIVMGVVVILIGLMGL